MYLSLVCVIQNSVRLQKLYSFCISKVIFYNLLVTHVKVESEGLTVKINRIHVKEPRKIQANTIISNKFIILKGKKEKKKKSHPF